MSKTFIIAGLGNPGKKYERSWHNCGYMVLEILSQRHDFCMRKIKFKSFYAEINLYGQKTIFLLPTTFMNNSGESIRAAVDFYKIPLENLLVIYDDIDIDVGKIRIRPWGSPGSHNGMRSIVQHLNDDNFPRIRVGIGPQVQDIDIVKYVLQSVPIDKQKILFEGLNKAADAVEIILQDTLDLAMNRLNGV